MLTAALLFGGLLLVYLPTATWDGLITNDQVATSVSAWSLGEHGTLALPETWHDVPWRSVTVDGRVVTNRFPGAIVWGAMFYALTPGDGDVPRAHDVPFGPATAAAATSAALAAAIVFLVLDRLVRRPVAFSGALLFALGTGTWSVSSDSLFTHGPAQLAFALALLALERDRTILAGLAMGAAITTRPTLAAAALVVGLHLGWTRHSLRPIVRIGLGSAVGLLAVSVYTWLLFGSWLPSAGYRVGDLTMLERIVGADDVPALWENLINMLVHPRRGMLLYSSFLVVLLFALRNAWRTAPDWVRGAALAGVSILVVHMVSAPRTFHGGEDFFGYRIPLEMLTLATPLLAMAGARVVAGSWLGRRALALTALASIVAFALGSTVSDPRERDREAYFQWLETLGPNGEGYDPGTAVGVDASSR